MADWSCSQRIVAPSLLAADFSRIGKEVARVVKSGGDWIHLDIMDGHFVDNISFGPAMVKTVNGLTNTFLEMITRPDRYLDRFVHAGSDMITVHVEAEHDVAETLRRIRDAGLQAGLALNPATPFEAAEPYLESIDLLLCMTVVPGFGGQAFMTEVLEKVKAAATERKKRGLGYHIEVDGGVDAKSSGASLTAGLVAGTATFRAADMAAAINAMREAAQPA